ncbi:hypothetical protein HH310_37875 [Actinoplanes sp. TBRC 11911]|uniref:hypothetical protein n=1 Tax=Actinoplanes sp. TBRC 11911 TaxID=2729386 RepID=UPI00145EBB8C|nr:hypothetical protein [Actinoplanes sp. TBRC 11911]NMO56931.1 hypothetical protein [Actinoplanes sp. TBRC 11911]
MSEVNGRIWVDPEGVSALGDRYADHAVMYDDYLRRLQALRVQYADAWGDDDMGREFSQKFLSGLDNLENLVGGVKGSLEYTAAGLRESGKMYREVDDDARTAGYKMGHDFSNLSVTGGGSAAPLEPRSGAPLEPRSAMPLEPLSGTPLGARSGTRLEARSGTPLEPRLSEPTLGTPAGSLASPAEPLLPTTNGLVAATPAISSYVERPEFRTALVGGQPLPSGFRLEALNPMPDGTTRVDANLYDSVSPVVYTSVTAPDGTAIDPDGRQFFLVKDNPHADPLAAGYRPMYVGYTADGSATPL